MAVVQEEGTDASLGEDREEERVEDWEHAEDGEGDADVGYYVGCAGHDEDVVGIKNTDMELIECVRARCYGSSVISISVDHGTWIGTWCREEGPVPTI